MHDVEVAIGILLSHQRLYFLPSECSHLLQAGNVGLAVVQIADDRMFLPRQFVRIRQAEHIVGQDLQGAIRSLRREI